MPHHAAVTVAVEACGSWEAVPAADVIDEGVVIDEAWVIDEGVVIDEGIVHEEPAFVGESVEVHGDAVTTDVVEPTLPIEEVVAPPATESRDAAAQPAAASVVVPDLQPAVDASRDDVQPASAVAEPVMKPVAEPELAQPAEAVAVEPAIAEPAVAESPSEPNLFEEADRSDELDPAPADEAVPSGATESPEPASPPTNPLDAAERRSGERPRLWVDATGRHATVGVLVEVRADGRCVIDTGTGLLEVRSADLRRRDRAYAAEAGARLAARRGPAPAETAGR